MAFVLMGMRPVTKLDAGNASEDIAFYVPMPGVDTPNFEVFSRDTQFTWVSNDRLSRDPAMQFTGPGEEQIVLEGKMYPYHFGGLSTLQRLREAGRRGKPHMIVRFYPLTGPSGYGAENLGTFVIKRVRAVEKFIGALGISHKIDFTLELTRYGDDLDQTPPSNNLPGQI